MKKQNFMQKIGFMVLLSAMLILCTAVLSMTAFAGSTIAYAEETTLTEAPLAYKYTAATEDEAAYYTVTGVDADAVALLSETQKKNLKITIPATYNSETGEAPVKVIGDNAFWKLETANSMLDFVSLDLSRAENLETIGQYSFADLSSTETLTLPKKLKQINISAFFRSRFSSIILNDELEFVAAAFTNMPNWHGTVKIPAKMQTTNASGNPSYVNIFTNTPIEAITVDPENPYYKAEDGILFSKDGTHLLAYPHGKAADVYRVPETVTIIAYRSIQEVKNIKTIILPSTLKKVDAYAFSLTSANVYLGSFSTETMWLGHCFEAFNGNLICNSDADREKFSEHSAFSKVSDKVFSIDTISASFNAGENIVDTNTTAEQLKQYFTVTGETASGITVPIYDFTLTLPENGLVGGNNTITLSLGEHTATATVTADKPTPVAPAAPTVSGTPSSDSITLTSIEGAEYSKDNGVTWQDSPTFTGLTPDTEYTFIARFKATDTTNASAASTVLTIKTSVSADNEKPNDNGGLSGGAIAGIVIASLAVAGMGGFAIFWFMIKKKKFSDLKEIFKKK